MGVVGAVEEQPSPLPQIDPLEPPRPTARRYAGANDVGSDPLPPHRAQGLGRRDSQCQIAELKVPIQHRAQPVSRLWRGQGHHVLLVLTLDRAVVDRQSQRHAQLDRALLEDSPSQRVTDPRDRGGRRAEDPSLLTGDLRERFAQVLPVIQRYFADHGEHRLGCVRGIQPAAQADFQHSELDGLAHEV